MPADIAPSPITAMTLLLLPSRSRATAMPRPAEIEVEECAAPNGSYSLSVALGEARQAAALAQGADAVAPAGEDLVRIGLVADVPDQTVARRVEHVVQRDRQLDDAEPGAEMAAGDRDGVDRLLAQLVGELAQLGVFEAAQLVRCANAVEQRGLGLGHEHLRGTIAAGNRTALLTTHDQGAQFAASRRDVGDPLSMREGGSMRMPNSMMQILRLCRKAYAVR